MEKYNFGNVDISFHTNKIFLLIQILYRIESLQDKIHSDNHDLSYLADSLKNFRELISKHKQGLKEFNTYKANAENKNMWAEYGEYISSFAQMDIKELKNKNPELANAIEELISSDFFIEVEKLNIQYSNEMEKRFIDQTKRHKEQAENIIGKTIQYIKILKN